MWWTDYWWWMQKSYFLYRFNESFIYFFFLRWSRWWCFNGICFNEFLYDYILLSGYALFTVSDNSIVLFLKTGTEILKETIYFLYHLFSFLNDSGLIFFIKLILLIRIFLKSCGTSKFLNPNSIYTVLKHVILSWLI